jgi:hypothetical protein
MVSEYPLCDLCGDYHEMLVGEKAGECPEAWAVEAQKRYEKMYLKWVESEKKIKSLESEFSFHKDIEDIKDSESSINEAYISVLEKKLKNYQDFIEKNNLSEAFHYYLKYKELVSGRIN